MVIRSNHELKISASCEWMSDEIGTDEVDKTTRQVDLESGEEGMGSVRQAEQYRVHPKRFTKLQTGEVFLWYGEMEACFKVQIDKEL